MSITGFICDCIVSAQSCHLWSYLRAFRASVYVHYFICSLNVKRAITLCVSRMGIKAYLCNWTCSESPASESVFFPIFWPTCHPCCHYYTWPQDTGNDTGVHIARVVQQILLWKQVPPLDLCIQKDPLKVPYIWYNPGTAVMKREEIKITPFPDLFMNVFWNHSWSNLIWWTLDFLQVLLNHIFWSLTCR